MSKKNVEPDIEYASKEYWERTCVPRRWLGNTWGTRWKAWTKIRYKKYHQLVDECINNNKFVAGMLKKSFGICDGDIKSQRILDVGCSDGDFLNYIYKENKCNELWGVDVASSAISELTRRFPKFKGVNCSIKEIDKFLNCKFDIVYCTGTVQCLEKNDYGIVFCAVNKIMKDEGVFLIEYPNNMSIEKERWMLSRLRNSFRIICEEFEYGGWYIETFNKFWIESFALEHPNTLMWIAAIFVLGNYPLAMLCERFTKLIGHRRHGVSGKILICRKIHK